MAAPVRLQVGIVGVGRVGAVLGAALARAGHEIIGVSGVSAQSRRRAEQFLPGVAIRAADEVVDAADLVLLTVPDDSLRALVVGLAATGMWRDGHLVAHTSGANGVGVLDAAAARGALAMALHPVMTFTGRPEDLDRLSGAPFGVTCADHLRPAAELLVMELGGDPVWVPEPARPLYHAALTVGANHLVTIVNDALDLLGGAGVEFPARLIAPLLSAALDNALRLGDAALTGPVSRADTVTLRTHLQTLAGLPQRDAYIALALRTAERAHNSGRLRQDQVDAITAVLSAP